MLSVYEHNLFVSPQLFGLYLAVGEQLHRICRSGAGFCSNCEHVTGVVVPVTLDKNLDSVLECQAHCTELKRSYDMVELRHNPHGDIAMTAELLSGNSPTPAFINIGTTCVQVDGLNAVLFEN